MPRFTLFPRMIFSQFMKSMHSFFLMVYSDTVGKDVLVNPFHTIALSIPPEIIRKHLVFWCFKGVIEKDQLHEMG